MTKSKLATGLKGVFDDIIRSELDRQVDGLYHRCRRCHRQFIPEDHYQVRACGACATSFPICSKCGGVEASIHSVRCHVGWYAGELNTFGAKTAHETFRGQLVQLKDRAKAQEKKKPRGMHLVSTRAA